MGEKLNRDESLDMAKGIAMLAVIAAHVGCVQPITIFFYIFHLPIFFIISGYFYHCESWKVFMRKKIKGYLIPYVSCALMIILFRFLFALFSSGSAVAIPTMKSDALALLLQQRYTTLWFLAALFLGIIIFDFLFRIFNESATFYFACCTLSVTFILYDTFIKIPLPWNLDTAFIIQFYLAFGHYAREKDLFRKISTESRHPWFLAAVFAIISIAMTLLNDKITGTTYEMFYSSYGIFPLTLTAAVLLSLAVIILAYRIHIRPVIYIGRNSMIYFAFHQSIAIPLASKEADSLMLGVSVGERLLHFLIVYALVILICFVFDIIIRHTVLKFMAGK